MNTASIDAPRYACGRPMQVALHLSKLDARSLLALIGESGALPSIFHRLKQAVKTYERNEAQQRAQTKSPLP